MRFCAVAAISGRPPALQSLGNAFHVDSNDIQLVEAVRAFCSENTFFFRGGQHHGRLRKDEVADAVEAFCSNALEELTSLVLVWSEGRDVAARRGAVRDAMRVLQTACGYFKGRAYWQKRFLEIIVLTKAGGRTSMDLDNAFDMWPVANGTRESRKSGPMQVRRTSCVNASGPCSALWALAIAGCLWSQMTEGVRQFQQPRQQQRQSGQIPPKPPVEAGDPFKNCTI